MSDYLIFTLYAPLASWGEIAVGERRGSWDRPSRSAVLGLVAAALGIVRSDQGAHDALDTGYGFGVRLDAPGQPLTDYHTAQTVAASVLKKVKPRTRKAILEAGKHETILSWRGYRTDALATAALWAKDGARWPLADLAAALKRPKFVLYAGRKADPFGWPLMPQVVVADGLAAALARRTYDDDGFKGLSLVKPAGGWGTEIAADAGAGLDVQRQIVRRDGGAHRTRWQFSERVVEVGR